MLTGLLGNLSLLSYFAKKKEKEAVVVQTLGVISTYVVIAQLAAAEAMPLPHFVSTSAVVAAGLILNLMNYFDLLPSSIWSFWEDFTTVGGLSVLPQVSSPPCFIPHFFHFLYFVRLDFCNANDTGYVVYLCTLSSKQYLARGHIIFHCFGISLHGMRA